MAIKIECVQCGFRNDLGRVFCTNCGVKLDLKRTSQADLEERREIPWGRIIGKLVGGVLAVAVLGVLALAFWPMDIPVVQKDAAGGQQVVLKTRAVKKALMARQKATVDFSEAELNGFTAGRAEARKLKALVVDIQPGAIEVSAHFSWRPGVVTNMTWLARKNVAVPVSLAIKAGFADGQMAVTGGRLGHLPLVGPLTGIPKRFFGDVFSDIAAEKQVMDALADVVFDRDIARVKFGK